MMGSIGFTVGLVAYCLYVVRLCAALRRTYDFACTGNCGVLVHSPASSLFQLQAQDAVHRGSNCNSLLA